MKKFIAIVLLFNLQSIFCNLQLHAQSLDSAEYFFDTDPGIGNGTAITVTAGDTILDSVYTSTVGLASGFHNLFYRVRDTNGTWSLYEGSQFYLYDTLATATPSSSPPLAAAEYFYDTDPGVGNATPMNAFTFTDTILLSDTLLTDSLTQGTHYLFVRVRDTLNVWSLYEGSSFVICNLIPVPDFSADTVCISVPTTLTDLSTSLDTNFNYTYGWDFNNDNIIDDTTKGSTIHTFVPSGTHTVSLIVNNTNGCADTIVKTIYVDSLPVVTLDFPADTICKDDTLMLAGGSPPGGTYSGPGVYGGAFYGDSVNTGFNTIFYTYYNSDSCSAYKNAMIYVSHCTGINEFENKPSVTVNPNPFHTTTLISVYSGSMTFHSFQFVLFDMFGKQVRDLTLESQNVKLERGDLSGGIYFYKVIGETGNYVSGKLVVIDQNP